MTKMILLWKLYCTVLAVLVRIYRLGHLIFHTPFIPRLHPSVSQSLVTNSVHANCVNNCASLSILLYRWFPYCLVLRLRSRWFTLSLWLLSSYSSTDLTIPWIFFDWLLVSGSHLREHVENRVKSPIPTLQKCTLIGSLLVKRLLSIPNA
jgi:hypothetical protein